MKRNLDMPWALRCAAEYEQNPTPGRAHNCAQQLGPALDEIDRLRVELRSALDELTKAIASPAYVITEGGPRPLGGGA